MFRPSVEVHGVKFPGDVAAGQVHILVSYINYFINVYQNTNWLQHFFF